MLLAAALLFAGAAPASTSWRFCGGEPERSAAQQDRVLQVAARLRELLQAQGQPAALVARAGTNLQRFGLRYTHGALALAEHALAPWGLRQMYFACDERRPRVVDQGLAGFLLGADDAERGFVSLLLLPAEAARPLAALPDAQARALLGREYMANAHPSDPLRQNCNQWLAEMLAAAWGADAANQAASETRSEAAPDASLLDRGRAQARLAAWGYLPAPVDYGSALWRAAAAFVPWVSMAGHPAADLSANRLVTSLPPDLEALARRLFPAAQRVELCYTATHWVLRREGPALADDCRAEAGDETGRF